MAEIKTLSLTSVSSPLNSTYSDSGSWEYTDFRTGYTSGNQWRSQLKVPIGADLTVGKSLRLVVKMTPDDYTAWPGTMLAVLSDRDLAPAEVLSANKEGPYRYGPAQALIDSTIAQSVAYSDAAGTAEIRYTKSGKDSFYFVFPTEKLMAGQTYYVYGVRKECDDDYPGYTVIDDISDIEATLEYESTYTVSYDSAGVGTAPDAVTVDAGGRVELPVMEAEGFIFRGWAETPGAAEGMTGEYTPTANITLYAVWVASATVTFDANGHGTAPEAVTVAQGEAVELPNLETRDYRFLGWAETATAKTGVTGSYTVEQNVTLYAVWESLGSVIGYNSGGSLLRCRVRTRVNGEAVRCRVRYNNGGSVVEV